MTQTESQRKAKAKYTHEKVRQVSVQFYPKDYALLEEAKKKAGDHGGLNAYIKELIERDLKETQA